MSDSFENDIYPQRVILTTYPEQTNIHPTPLNWNASTPKERGPILVSRHPTTLNIRNAIGAYGGSYCIYRALSVVQRELKPDYIPNLFNTEPSVKLGPVGNVNVVSMDPWGHVTVSEYKEWLQKGIDIRPTIAITKAHMHLPEIEIKVRNGSIKVDGKVVVGKGGDVKVVKAAVEPVWYLPGVADRFGVEEGELRRCLFEETGGMYPELITRSDLKVFLPPIGGLTVYIFGDVENVGDVDKKLTVRVHDECNGSDVFGSDICTCRPYLTFGIEECVKTAQEGGSGVIVYYRKEGRALGEVTKYLVYNARKRAEGGDTARDYFQRTENVAGVKDARFQALMPDILHWLGIKKYDAIVKTGIKILERVQIPEELIPADSQVEIDAKIASGYFTTGQVKKENELEQVKGRTWDDVVH